MIIVNDGPKIKQSNFWGSEQERRGMFYLNANAGVLRLLMPEQHEGAIPNFETADEIIICQGPWPDAGEMEAMEIIFDDLTDSPFRVLLPQNQVDHFPPATETGSEFDFSVWVMRGGAPTCVFDGKCVYQVAKGLPIDLDDLMWKS